MIRPDLAIVGGGLLGRLLAWRAALCGFRVSLYDAGTRAGCGATAWVAGGMVAPMAESIDTDAELIGMGNRSLTLWPNWLRELGRPVHYSDSGTIVLWHRSDNHEAVRFESSIRMRNPDAYYERLNAEQLTEREPAVARSFREALFLPGEAHIDNRQLLGGLADAVEAVGVVCHWNRPVADSESIDARLLVDCRGAWAKSRWRELRGVRGEIIRLHAPQVELCQMIRLLHPRQSIYIVPRPDGHIVVGATSVESDDRSPVSVRGALELLSAAYRVLPELGEARVLELNSGCRPALPQNRPEMRYSGSRRILELNGLYRHGFLLSPCVVERALSILPLLLRDPDTSLDSSLSLLPQDEGGVALQCQ